MKKYDLNKYLERVKSILKNKRNQLIIITVLAIIMLTLGFFSGRLASNKSYVLKTLQSSVENENLKKLEGIIRVNGESDKITKDEIKPLVDFLKTDNLRLLNLMKALSDDKNVYSLALKSEKGFFGNKYYIDMVLVNLDIDCNFDDSNVYLNEELKGNIKDGKLSVQDIVPGSYKIKIEKKSEYCNLKKEEEINITENTTYDGDLTGLNVSVDSDFKDAYVYINDSNSNMQVKDFKDIGPFPTDESYYLSIKAQTPWGEIESEKKTIGGYPEIKLPIDVKSSSVLNDEIQKSLKEFYKSSFDALNNGSRENIKNATDEVKDKIFNNLTEKYFIFKNDYEISGLDVKMENSEVFYNDENYTGNIVVKLSYNVAKKVLGFEIENSKQELNLFTKVKYENENWIVYEVENFS